jgi:hypothetical protein
MLMATADAAIADYLDADERVVWSGTPVRGWLFRREDRYLFPFGLFWLGLTLFLFGMMAIGGPRDAPPLPFLLVPALFVGLGLYFVVGRFLWDADVRGRTTYVLTNRRAVVLRRFPRRRVTSLRINAATEVQTIERSDGSGTIYFGPRPNAYNNAFPRPSPDMFMFERIRDFKTALQIVRSTAHAKS